MNKIFSSGRYTKEAKVSESPTEFEHGMCVNVHYYPRGIYDHASPLKHIVSSFIT